MIKIFVGKSETADAVVQKIKSLGEADVVLVIPRDSELKSSVSNFKVIKRVAGETGKNIAVESVDSEVLKLAADSEIDGLHPLFKKGGAEKILSDIVSSPAGPKAKKTDKRKTRGMKAEEPPPAIQEEPSPPVYSSPPLSAKVSPLELEEKVMAVGAEPPKRSWISRVSFGRRGWMVFGGVILIAAAGVLITAKAFGRVTVSFNFKRTPWQYEGNFLASKALHEANPERLVVPGELFFDVKNLTQSFPASGKEEQVSLEGKGMITIYNAYSATPQPLVATTRFETPEGKIFRLDKAVVVPGARVVDGEISPSSVDAAITADLPGSLYNVSSSRLTIPGFKGTPRYEKFYGAIAAPVSGGFIGKKAVATNADIAAAKEKVSETLKSSFSVKILERIPSDFKIFEEASRVAVKGIDVNRNTDEKRNFSVSGEAEIKALGFKESDVVSLLSVLSSKDHSDKRFRDLKLTYDKVSPNFEKGELSFFLKAEGVLQPSFDPDGFRDKILGKKLGEIKELLAGFTDLAEAKVSFWPFWLMRAPFDLERVKVNVE